MRKIAYILLVLLMLMPLGGAALGEEPESMEEYNLPNWPYRNRPTAGLQELDPGAGMKTCGPFNAYVNGRQVPMETQNTQHAGVMIPDGKGGYVWSGAFRPMQLPCPGEAAGRELKLKVRELADQLLSVESMISLGNGIALPTSFVNQDNFQQSSSFGRYIAEQMFYELNQRGMAVREYRTGNEIVSRPGEGDFFLSRNAGNIVMNSRRAVALVGTYYSDDYNVYVNARLINGVTGMVLRTANVVFPQTQVTRSMLARTTLNLQKAYTQVMDFQTVNRATDLTAIDLGEDIH